MYENQSDQEGNEQVRNCLHSTHLKAGVNPIKIYNLQMHPKAQKQ